MYPQDAVTLQKRHFAFLNQKLGTHFLDRNHGRTKIRRLLFLLEKQIGVKTELFCLVLIEEHF